VLSWGKLSFNATAEGRIAEGMVARGEIAGISAGYRVEEWQITDDDGTVIDPESARWDDDDLTFTATRWELLEASLVLVPADSASAVRSFGDTAVGDLVDVRQRMLSRQRIV
jgi:phage head maturation protease